MKTISSVVESYIRRKPFLQTALSEGIINLTSLSRYIKPEVEEVLRKEVRDGAIVMALKRLSENLEFLTTHKIVKVLKDIGEITVRSSLTDYTFQLTPSILSSQLELMREIENMPDIFYTSSRGVNEINIVVSNRLEKTVERIFQNEICTQKAEQLASVSVKLPSENVTVPGIYYFIFQRLAWEGIVLYEVISTTNEFTILVDDIQADKAFSIIKALKNL
ncbi:MAG: aspartate kinase [Flavobacteriaceae bacterium]|nr:aspartate kinase [Flavobacteriaceae bacterium]